MIHHFEKIVQECKILENEKRTSELLYSLSSISLETVNLLGLYYFSLLKDTNKSVNLLKAASKIEPENWLIYNNIAHVLNASHKYPEAEKAILQALHFCDDQHDCYYNAGVIAGNLKKFENSIEYYKTAYKINKKPLTAFNLSSSLLFLGKYEEGFEYYDARFDAFDIPKNIKNRFSKPVWNGENAQDKTILVFSEQGLGDLIQFSRYLPVLKTKSKAKIILECQSCTKNLFEENKKKLKIDEIKEREDNPELWPKESDYENIDYIISVCSLPKVFKTNVENILNKKYLSTSLKHKIKSGKIKIGIAWAGNHGHGSDYNRSCMLNNFEEISNLKNIELYSLQKNLIAERDWGYYGTVNLLQNSQNVKITDLSQNINDFRDLASCINAMDLIISVDTSVLHLASAMGKPTWGLLAYLNDWRWGLNENSIWYPNTKLIRQKTHRDWKPVFEEVANLLKLNYQ